MIRKQCAVLRIRTLTVSHPLPARAQPPPPPPVRIKNSMVNKNGLLVGLHSVTRICLECMRGRMAEYREIRKTPNRIMDGFFAFFFFFKKVNQKVNLRRRSTPAGRPPDTRRPPGIALSKEGFLKTPSKK